MPWINSIECIPSTSNHEVYRIETLGNGLMDIIIIIIIIFFIIVWDRHTGPL